ncbi:hypothetical protein VSDG_02783 [Cytospora chrysosperma]|uniref:Uncharacterized protein n=1 Tax=Cytospora chrysosperma TaxID=252740 RepID=A0A423WCS4_CYTCH|nr:hypothetical protein VSDG_02783 [Valsa sordida]
MLVGGFEGFDESGFEVVESSEVLDKTSGLLDDLTEEAKLTELEGTLDVRVDENGDDLNVLLVSEEVLDKEGVVSAESDVAETCPAAVPVTLGLVISGACVTEDVDWYVEEDSTTAIEEESDCITDVAEESDCERDPLAN